MLPELSKHRTLIVVHRDKVTALGDLDMMLLHGILMSYHLV